MRAKVERRGIGGEDIEVRRSKHRGVGATHPTAADPPGPSVVRPTTIDSRFVSSASRGSTTPARLARPDQDAVAQGRSRPPAAAHGRVGTAYRGRGRSSSSAPRPSSLEARGGAKGTRARAGAPGRAVLLPRLLRSADTLVTRTRLQVYHVPQALSLNGIATMRVVYAVFRVPNALLSIRRNAEIMRYRVRVAYKPTSLVVTARGRVPSAYSRSRVVRDGTRGFVP